MTRTHQEGQRRINPRIEGLESRTLLSSGALDPNFGAAGKVVTPFPIVNYSSQLQVASDSNGKILETAANGVDFDIFRYLPTGAADTSFGKSGKLVLDTAGGKAVQPSGITVLPNTEILVNGATSTGAFLMLLKANGTADTTFGTGGVKFFSFPGTTNGVNALVRLSSGKILAATGVETGMSASFIVERFNANGSLDTTFGTSGVSTIGVDPNTGLVGMAVQSTGKIIMLGEEGGIGGSSPSLLRLNSNGSRDSTYVDAGLPISGRVSASSLTIQSDNKIILTALDDSFSGYLVARFGVNGSRDTTFNGTGYVETAIGNFTTHAGGAVVEPDGKIDVAGTASGNVEVVRYLSNGSLDTSFATGGKDAVTFTGGSLGGSIVLQSSGRIVVGASVGNPSNAIGTARILGDHTVLTADQSMVTTGASLAADPRLAGTVIASRTVTVTTGNAPTSFNGQVKESVVRETVAGTLDFYYQIINSSGPMEPVAGFFNLIAAGFGGFSTYVDYRPDSTGTIAPVTASDSGGATITFNFAPVPTGNGDVTSGTTSHSLFVKTNATNFDVNGTMILNNVINYDGYEPVKPPPPTPNTISGVVFRDTNGNGTLDAGETGVGGFTVNLYEVFGNSASRIATFSTLSDGSYHFDLLSPATYYVYVVNQPSTYQPTGKSLTYYQIKLTAGGAAANQNFGEKPK